MEQSIEELEQELADAFDEARETIKKMSEMNFGYKILAYDAEDSNALEAVSIIECNTSTGVLFVPVVVDYIYCNPIYTGQGYKSRELALQCVGRSWDLAKDDILNQIKASKEIK